MSTEERVVRCLRAACAEAGVSVPQSRVSKIARRFVRLSVEDPSLSFHGFLVGESQCRVARVPPSEWARVIAYADPTGETAVANVLRG